MCFSPDLPVTTQNCPVNMKVRTVRQVKQQRPRNRRFTGMMCRLEVAPNCIHLSRLYIFKLHNKENVVNCDVMTKFEINLQSLKNWIFKRKLTPCENVEGKKPFNFWIFGMDFRNRWE